jgi:hypothetical protein
MEIAIVIRGRMRGPSEPLRSRVQLCRQRLFSRARIAGCAFHETRRPGTQRLPISLATSRPFDLSAVVTASLRSPLRRSLNGRSRAAKCRVLKPRDRARRLSSNSNSNNNSLRARIRAQRPAAAANGARWSADTTIQH